MVNDLYMWKLVFWRKKNSWRTEPKKFETISFVLQIFTHPCFNLILLLIIICHQPSHACRIMHGVLTKLYYWLFVDREKKPAYFLLVKINCLFLIILIQHFCSVYSTKKMFSFSLCVLLSMPIFQLKMNKPKGDTHTCRIFAYSLSSLIFSIYIHETFNLLIEDKRLNHQISCHFYQIENGKFMKVIFCLFLVKCFECVCNFAFFSTSPLLTSQCYLGQPVYFSKISIWVDSLCNKK